MKSFATVVTLAFAAAVSAQISALPPCALSCGLTAAEATSCSPPTNFNCTCQVANQAIIAPLLEACLEKTCTNATEIQAAISAGEGICAHVSQTAVASSAATAVSSAYATAMASTTTSPAMNGTYATGTAMSSGSPPASSSAVYMGAAAAMPSGAIEVVVAAAGMAMLVL